MATEDIDLSPDSLRKIAKRAKLDEELKKLELNAERLKVRAEIEGIDVSDKIKEIDQEIERLEKEREEFGSYKHPFLELTQKQKQLLDRLEKLESKKTQIQESVYESLKNEYLGEKEAILQQIGQTIIKLKEIKEGASKGAQSLKYSLEELSVRKEIEEIPEDIYNERISNLKAEMNQSEELKTAVDFLLNMVES